MSGKKAGDGSKKKWTRIFLLILTVTFAFVYKYIFDEKLNLGGDNAGYYILGKSLSQGTGYTNIHQPAENPHNHFPPGYPVILSFFMLFSKSITFIKIINGLFLLGSSLLTFKLLMKFTDDARMAFVGALLMLFNFHLLQYSTIMMSEIPYLFFSLLVITLFVNSVTKENPFKDYQFYLVIVLSAFTFHIRTAGIALVGGLALYLLVIRNFKYLLGYISGFILLAIPWIMRSQSIGGNSYLQQLLLKNPYRKEKGMMGLEDLWTRFVTNLERYVGKEIPNGLLPSIEVVYRDEVTAMQLITGVAILGLIVFGLVKLPKFRNILIFYFAGTFFILLLWPDVWFGVRFMLPLIPFLMFLAAFGVYELFKLILSKIGLNAPSPLVMLILLPLFFSQIGKLKESADGKFAPSYNNYLKIANWAGKNLPADAVVSCRKPSLFYLYSNRQAFKYPSSYDYQKITNAFKDNRVTHVVVDQLGYSSTSRYLVPYVQANQVKFTNTIKYDAPETFLIAFNPNMGYDGEWRAGEATDTTIARGVKEGIGTFTYRNGSVYEGEWKNDKRNGKGKMTFADGRVSEGIWQNDNLITE